MDSCEYEALFELLRMALCRPDSLLFSKKLSDQEWERLHENALKQLLAGILYDAVRKLPQDLRPSMDLIFQWASEAETIKGQNIRLNSEASRLIQLFAERGYKAVVLKGSANARLYPNPYARQVGDIDLWVDCGKAKVVDLLESMGFKTEGYELFVDHHVHFVDNEIFVEVHYRVSSGNFNYFKNARMQRYLEREMLRSEVVPEGFCVPSIKFALVMQLSHIQRHFLECGIGFKQIVDYYILLQQSTEVERREVAANLKKFGMYRSASALMWLLHFILGLEKSKMLCAPNARLGKKMLAEIGEGGNFGNSYVVVENNFIQAWMNKKRRVLRLFSFDPLEMIWHEIYYWKVFIKSISLRIRLRKFSIWEVYR